MCVFEYSLAIRKNMPSPLSSLQKRVGVYIFREGTLQVFLIFNESYQECIVNTILVLSIASV